MFGIDKDADTIYNELVYKALSIASVREFGDSSIKDLYHTTFNTNNPLSNFINRYGKMSDGLNVKIPDAELSYNILTSMVLTKDPLNHNEIWISNNRFGNNLDSLFVYVNGMKIPDSAINMYITDSNTNLIIAKKFFINGDNDIIIEKRRFDNYSYGGTYVENFNSDVLIFNVSEHRNLIINDYSSLVFVNGIYQSKEPYGDISFVSFVDNTVTVKFNKTITGRVEVFIDSSSKYSNTKKINGNSSIVPFYIDDSFIDPIYGPINRDNCSFFINGKRINNIDVVQKGRLHFTIEKNITENDIFSLVYSDNSEVDIRSFKLYGDDYFFYNLIGSENITNKLMSGSDTGKITMSSEDFSSINYDEVLHSSEYSYSETLDIINSLNSILDVELRIQELIRRCPYLLKDFLENFASESINKTITYNGEEKITIGVGNTYNVGTKVIRIISVNGVIVKIDKFITTSISYNYEEEPQSGISYWKSEIDGSFFTIGENSVEIVESTSNSNNKMYKVVNIDRYETLFDDYDYRATCDVFGTIENIDDFEMMAITKKKNDPDGIYLNSNGYGFKIIKAPKMIIDNKIYVSFGPNDPHIDMFIIMITRHHDHKIIQINSDDLSYESLFNELSCGIESFFDTEDNTYHDIKIPIIHYGSIVVSKESNGLRLFRGIDFSYKYVNKNTNLRNSGIIFQKNFNAGDTINVILTPEYTSSDTYISASELDSGPNKYALIYLNHLKFPYSPKYVKLFANNKTILEKDVDILSNKLIRLHSIDTVCANHVPDEITGICPNCINGGNLHNVYCEFAFKVSFPQLNPFIINNNSSESDFEKEIEKLFLSFNIMKSKEIGENIDIDAVIKTNNIYSSLDNDVDSNQKTPNNIVEGSFLSDLYDLYIDAYLRWFKSERSDQVFNSIKDIPECVLNEINIFKNDYDNDNNDVVIKPEKKNLLSDVEISTKFDKYLGFYNDETVKTFLQCCIENEISIQECFKRYEEFTQSTEVFKRDLLPISALQTFEGEDIVIGRGKIFKGN